MYAITPAKTPHRDSLIDDGPIAQFADTIEHVKVEQWQKRSAAFQSLVSSIPQDPQSETDSTMWYTSPKIIRHLAIPLSELLKDPRSSVVKRTCESASELFSKLRADARYLLRDIMPVILGLHAQTVQVIRNYVQAMVTESLPVVPCKAVMPMWLEKLKEDKSRTVKEACVIYLSLALQSWTEEGYLTDEIWLQVGISFTKSLQAAYPSVRSEAKKALELFRASKPDIWENIVNDPSGPASKDPKLRRTLVRMGSQDDSYTADDTSLGSRSFASGSYRSGARRGRGAAASARPVPTNVVVGDGADAGRRGLGPPMRSNFSKTSPPKFRNNLSNPARRTTTTTRPPFASTSSPPLNRNHRNSKSPSPTQQMPARKSHSPTLPKKQQPIVMEFSPPSRRESSPARDEVFPSHNGTLPLEFEGEGPFVASMRELKKHASKRRSRRSSIMLERWRSSSGLGSSSGLLEEGEDNGSKASSKQVDPPPATSSTESVGNTTPVPNGQTPEEPTTTTPEHVQIAQQLLEAHRLHIDNIMDTLRLEMDALKDFETLLLDENKPSRPTEEDVLDYFESVGLCLDQRTSRGKELQKEMDRISHGGTSSS